MKKTYGKTANERKAEHREKEDLIKQRIQKQQQKMEKRVARQEERDRLDELLASDTSEAIAFKRTRKQRFIVMIMISFFVMVSILSTILIVTYDPYRKSPNPVAVIHMSDGRKMAFQLFPDEAPIAVAWFFFYSQKHPAHGINEAYYSGTIIDTISGDAIKMGGYETSLEFNEATRVKMMQQTSPFYDTDTFRVYMNDDVTVKNRSINQLGVLSTIKLDSAPDKAASAEFQICAANPGEQGIMPSDGRAFGLAYDDATIENILYYKGLNTTSKNFVTAAATVKIDYIKFYALGDYEPPNLFDTSARSGFVKQGRY